MAVWWRVAAVLAWGGPGLAAPPLIIAHRGASHDAPENTLAAFREAALQGADAVEMDARMTADGEVVLVHDGSVNRTTDGEGSVGSYQLADLKELDAGSWFGEKFAGEPVPTLAEAVVEIRGGMRIMIDSKGASPRALRQTLVEAGLPLEDVVIFNWGGGQIGGFSRDLPEAPYLPTLPRRPVPWGPEVIARWRDRGADGFAANHSIIDRAFVQGIRSAGMQVVAWTVNDPERARELAVLGVDGIITDRPAFLRAALRETDADWDGLADEWEQKWLGGTAQDGATDTDGDGLTEAEEQAAGTAPVLADSDGDRLGDGWEWRHGFDPSSWGSPSAETFAAYALGDGAPELERRDGSWAWFFRVRRDPVIRWTAERSIDLLGWEALEGSEELGMGDDEWDLVRVEAGPLTGVGFVRLRAWAAP